MKIRCTCGELSTWVYGPGFMGLETDYFCDECVPRGCTCGDPDEPCCEYTYDVDGFEISLAEIFDDSVKVYNKNIFFFQKYGYKIELKEGSSESLPNNSLFYGWVGGIPVFKDF